MEKQQQTICLRQRKPRQPQPPESGEHPREEKGAEALPGPQLASEPTGALTPPETSAQASRFPVPLQSWGTPPFPQEQRFGVLRAACVPSLPAKPLAQLIDEWALDMIDRFDGMKRRDYLMLVDFSKCLSCRHRTFVPLSLLTPLLTTNLCNDLAWPV